MTDTQTLGCGHPPTEDRSVGTGYAEFHGRRVCYACANEIERRQFAEATVYSAYVNEAKRIITTWPGAELARITRVTRGARRWMPNLGGAYRMRYVWATAPDGSQWHGKGSDDYDLVTLRRLKAR